MLTINKIKNLVLVTTFVLFSLPFAFPDIELFFIFLQFGLFIPVFLFLSSFSTNLYGYLLLIIYLMLLILAALGLPGSFIGWMSMACMGYFFGSLVIRGHFEPFSSTRFFIALTVTLSWWVIYQNYQNLFSYELLSDYFESSSINTVPILLVCSVNLYCAVYYYLNFLNKDVKKTASKEGQRIIYILSITAILSVIIFEFRSGFFIFPLLILVLWSSLGSGLSSSSSFLLKTVIFFLFSGLILFLWDSFIYQFILGLIVPGRDEIVSVTEELSAGALRYDRMIKFWEVSALSKTNFILWSESLSVSGMSDFIAGLFPISILLFYPSIYLFKLFKYLRSADRIPAVIVFTASMSSLLISILQPDFYSLFSFFAISSVIYFGERNEKKKRLLLLRQSR